MYAPLSELDLAKRSLLMALESEFDHLCDTAVTYEREDLLDNGWISYAEGKVRGIIFAMWMANAITEPEWEFLTDMASDWGYFGKYKKVRPEEV